MKAKDTLPVSDLRRLFRYDPDSGGIFWNARTRMDFNTPPSEAKLTRWNAEHAGTEAFTRKTEFGYKYETALGKTLLAHRVAFAVTHDRHPADQIDHQNGDRADNRIANLREVSNQQNAKNQRRRVTNASGTTGVFWSAAHGKWLAQIRSNGRCYSLGRHDDIEAAIAARKAAEIKLGFHKNHGSEQASPEISPEAETHVIDIIGK